MRRRGRRYEGPQGPPWLLRIARPLYRRPWTGGGASCSGCQGPLSCSSSWSCCRLAAGWTSTPARRVLASTRKDRRPSRTSRTCRRTNSETAADRLVLPAAALLTCTCRARRTHRRLAAGSGPILAANGPQDPRGRPSRRAAGQDRAPSPGRPRARPSAGWPSVGGLAACSSRFRTSVFRSFGPVGRRRRVLNRAPTLSPGPPEVEAREKPSQQQLLAAPRRRGSCDVRALDVRPLSCVPMNYCRLAMVAAWERS